MLENYTVEELAGELYDAQVNRSPVGPLTEKEPGITVDEAYAVQIANIRRLTGEGHVIVGKKIGLTSLVMQQMMNVNEPDYGHLLDTMHIKDGMIPMDNLLQPKMEGEIAFILGKDLQGPDVTPEQVLEATEYVSAALEVVDSRVKDWKIKLPDTVADNASSGCYVISDKRVPVSDVVLTDVEMVFYKNGEELNRGKGSAALGDPALCVAWLANKLWAYGVTLKKGEVVLSGALSAAVNAERGDVFRAEMSVLGPVEGRFV